MSDPKRYRKNPDVSWRTVEGQAVLVLNREGEVQVLNEVGTFIWERLEKEPPAELARAIASEFQVPEAEALGDLEEFLQSLLDSGALLPVG